jgi:hypothetical protein
VLLELRRRGGAAVADAGAKLGNEFRARVSGED